MLRILHITHPHFNMLVEFPNSELLTSVTQDISKAEYHTSLGDLGARDIVSLIDKFDRFNFLKDCFDSTTSIYQETIGLLNYASHRIAVDNFSVGPITTFVDKDVCSRPDCPVLWVFGCSHSHGVGLTSPGERYSNLLSEVLNLPLQSCTLPGSSLHWSLRHLINANLKSFDTVVWQITVPERLTLYEHNITKEVLLARTTDRNLLRVYTDQQIFFNHISLLNTGINYLRAKGVKFVLTSIDPPSKIMYDCKIEYTKYLEYCYTPKLMIDRGTDNLHAGPLAHKRLALALENHIQYIYDKSI